MGIDWFTTVAQIVNFLVLAIVLRYALWGRVTRALDARAARLAAENDAARRDKEEAGNLLDAARAREADREKERAQKLEEVRTEVADERLRLLTLAREEVGVTTRAWSAGVEEDRQRFIDALRRRTAEDVCRVAREVLGELADARLEESVVRRFLRVLAGADEESLAQLRAARTVEVVSPAALPDDLRATVTDALRERLRDDAEVRFVVDPALVCGIALRTGGHSLEWSVGHFMDALVERVATNVDEQLDLSRTEPGRTREEEAARGAREASQDGVRT